MADAWDYAARGPDAWPVVEPGCAGSEQSPIAIDRASATRVGGSRMGIELPQSTDVVVRRTDIALQAWVPGLSRGLTFRGLFHQFDHVHVHVPAEHVLDGHTAAAEIHLVHRSAGGKLAVVGVMLEAGADHPALRRIWGQPPSVGGEGVVTDVNLSSLVPQSDVIYHYIGSLTVPPCTEGVKWFLVDAPLQVAAAQLDTWRGIFSGSHFPHGNARPQQPLNHREISAIDRY